MKWGILWFCGDETIEKGIRDAAKRYFEKYGIKPNTAYVNPKDIPETPIEGMNIKTRFTIMPNHVWIGVGE